MIPTMIHFMILPWFISWSQWIWSGDQKKCSALEITPRVIHFHNDFKTLPWCHVSGCAASWLVTSWQCFEINELLVHHFAVVYPSKLPRARLCTVHPTELHCSSVSGRADMEANIDRADHWEKIAWGGFNKWSSCDQLHVNRNFDKAHKYVLIMGYPIIKICGEA